MSNHHKKRGRKLKHQKRRLNKSNKYMLLFLLLLIILNAVSVSMFFILGINPFVSLIWFVILSVVCFFGKDIIKQVNQKYYDAIKNFIFGAKNNDAKSKRIETDEKTEEKKRSPLRVAISVLCIVLLFVGAFGDVVSAVKSNDVILSIWPSTKPTEPSAPTVAVNTESSEESTEEPTNHVGQIDYDLERVMDWDNFYFLNEKVALQLCANLNLALGNIKRIDSISGDVLNRSKDYGGNADLAIKYTKQFDDYYDAKADKYAADPKVVEYYNKALSIRQKMEKVYITPENRKEISTLFFKAGIYGLVGNCQDNLNQALRYAWGTLVIRVSWGEYSETDIERLERIYSFLKSTDTKNTKQLNIILEALKLLKVQISEEPIKD